MLYEEYAKVITRSAGFGLAEMAYRELSGQAQALPVMQV
jgi:Rod binding domain-containing protein